MIIPDFIGYSMAGITFLAICFLMIKIAFVLKEVTKPADK